MKKLLPILLLFLLLVDAHAQTSPGWSYGYTPTAAQWNAAFAGKQDVLGYVPLNTNGGTMLGELIAAPSTASGAGFNIVPGVAPITPNNGDIWTTATGLFAQINGSTIQIASSGGSILNNNNTWSGTNTWTSTSTFNAFAYYPANLLSTTPVVATGGLAISYNFGGINEVDFWNTVVNPGTAFIWKVMTGTNTFTNLASILPGGGIGIYGSTSGIVSIAPQAAAGTYNFNLPTTPGTAGQILASGGGGSAPMTWATAGAGSVTSVQVAASAGLSVSGTCTITASGVCTVNQMLPPQGRLTLTSGTPVMTASATGSQNVFYAPYVGYTVPIYNGTAMISYQFTSSTTDTVGLTLALATSANWVAGTVYDVFVTLVTGNPTLCTGPAWTSATARSAAGVLGKYNGYYVNGAVSSMTCRTGAASTISVATSQATYLGTILIDAGTAGQVSFTLGATASGGTAAFLNIWNYYNRVPVNTSVVDNGTEYAYTTAATRSARASTANRINFVSGAAEEGPYVTYLTTTVDLAVQGAFTETMIGIDSTSVNIAPASICFNNLSGGQLECSLTSIDPSPPQLGSHFFQALERGDGSNANDFDSFSGNTLSMNFKM